MSIIAVLDSGLDRDGGFDRDNGFDLDNSLDLNSRLIIKNNPLFQFNLSDVTSTDMRETGLEARSRYGNGERCKDNRSSEMMVQRQ
jgi:hypothetical protein